MKQRNADPRPSAATNTGGIASKIPGTQAYDATHPTTTSTGAYGTGAGATLGAGNGSDPYGRGSTVETHTGVSHSGKHTGTTQGATATGGGLASKGSRLSFLLFPPTCLPFLVRPSSFSSRNGCPCRHSCVPLFSVAELYSLLKRCPRFADGHHSTHAANVHSSAGLQPGARGTTTTTTTTTVPTPSAGDKIKGAFDLRSIPSRRN